MRRDCIRGDACNTLKHRGPFIDEVPAAWDCTCWMEFVSPANPLIRGSFF